MTKAERILELYKTGKYTMTQIAGVIGCRPEYVRVVARQRQGTHSEADARYMMSLYGASSYKAAKQAQWLDLRSDPTRYAQHKEAHNARRRKRRAEARA